MPEFLDFLKHKYAYVAIGEFKPGCFSEAQKLPSHTGLLEMIYIKT